jgi:hypothetical protein
VYIPQPKVEVGFSPKSPRPRLLGAKRQKNVTQNKSHLLVTLVCAGTLLEERPWVFGFFTNFGVTNTNPISSNPTPSVAMLTYSGQVGGSNRNSTVCDPALAR